MQLEFVFLRLKCLSTLTLQYIWLALVQSHLQCISYTDSSTAVWGLDDLLKVTTAMEEGYGSMRAISVMHTSFIPSGPDIKPVTFRNGVQFSFRGQVYSYMQGTGLNVSLHLHCRKHIVVYSMVECVFSLLDK